MAIPFVVPVPLPGLSTPFGLILTVIGAGLAFGRRPWLPGRLLQRELPPKLFHAVLAAGATIVGWIELFARPRLGFLHEQGIYRRAAGTLIAVSGALLLLPLPIPFTNTLPALTVLLLSAGSIERDGYFFIGGCATFVLTVAYFAALTLGGAHALDALALWLQK